MNLIQTSTTVFLMSSGSGNVGTRVWLFVQVGEREKAAIQFA